MNVVTNENRTYSRRFTSLAEVHEYIKKVDDVTVFWFGIIPM